MKYLIMLFLFPSAYALTTNIEGGVVKGNNNTGSIARAQVAHRFENTLNFGLYYQNVTRIFTGSNELSDTQMGLNGSYQFHPSFYLESQIGFSADKVFFPQAQYSITPHIIAFGVDFWIGYSYSDFTNFPISTYRVGALKEHSFFTFGGQLFLTDSNPSAASAHLFIFHDFDQLHLRLDISSGRTVEDDNLIGSFNAFSLLARRKFKYLEFGPKIVIYDGSVRDEQQFLLNLFKKF